METTLLATKLFIPPAAPGLVARPRLLEKLKAALTSRLVLISAPAGFGKTTILSQWIHQAKPPIPTAWLSLAETENDPTRFWEYFIAAVRTIRPAVGETAVSLLQASQPVPIESALTDLVNDLTTVQNDFVLVLDDYHFIQSLPVHRGLTFLVEHIPPRMHLVISTRADPPLPLPHLRGRGLMLEIGADDLRFTLAEATGLLRTLLEPELPLEDLRAINTHAEGWVVGLKMAALSLGKQKDVKASIAAFTGSQRYIMDYLMDEVLGQQSPEVRDFLLKTSILGRLSAPLCDAVTGRSDAADVLGEVERNHLFIVPLDESRRWYRYEHLFAELLQHRLEVELGKERVAELQKRASRWYEGNHFAEDAIDHALAAQDWEKAMELIVESVSPVKFGGLVTYNWLKQVPQEVLRTNAGASLVYASSIGIVGRLSEAKALLDEYEKLGVFPPSLAGRVAAIRTLLVAWQGGLRIEEYASKALSLLPADDLLMRGVVSHHLGLHYVLTGRSKEAVPPLNAAYDLWRRTGDDGLASTSLAFLGIIAMGWAGLQRAEEMFKQAIGLGGRHPNTVTAHLYLGAIYYLRNELDAAIAEHEKGIALSPDSRNLAIAHLRIAGARLAQGNIEAAEQATEQAERAASSGYPVGKVPTRIAACRAGLAVARGDDESASRWLDKVVDYEDLFGELPIASVRLLIQRRGRVLQERLKSGYEKQRKEGVKGGLVLACVALAFASSRPDEALSFLSEALAAGKPDGQIRSFVDWGMELAPLLRKAISRGIEPEYARMLLHIIEAEERQRRIRRGEMPSSSATKGVLSEREMEVLRLVGEGLSNQQIAAKLTISLNTAKTHVYRAFGKLDARDRVQALKRARELKLI